LVLRGHLREKCSEVLSSLDEEGVADGVSCSGGVVCDVIEPGSSLDQPVDIMFAWLGMPTYLSLLVAAWRMLS